MRVSVIGLGYIGLPTTLMMAAHGVDVVGVDYKEDLVATLRQGQTTFQEEGLDVLFKEALRSGVAFSTSYQKADVYIIAVPTPYDSLTKKIDPSYIVGAVQKIMHVCNKGAIIVIESTIAPGTIDKFVRPLIVKNKFVIGQDIHIVHAPERIIPGNMIHELKYNARTIGADSKEVAEQIRSIYASFCKGNIVITDIRTAEMTKVIENTFRDINIAFANEVAKICRTDNMDVQEIIRIANMHPRVNILQPGPGVGGHCISIDPWFLVGEYPQLANLVYQARKINDSMPEFVLERISEIMKIHDIKDANRIGVYGLTYKEDVDDVRESPTLQLLECMEKHLAHGIKLYDPKVKKKIVDNQYEDFGIFLSEIDMIVIMVGHNHIKENIEKLRNKVILDTRYICELENTYRL